MNGKLSASNGGLLRRVIAWLCVVAIVVGSCGGETEGTSTTAPPARTSSAPTTQPPPTAPAVGIPVFGGTVVIGDDQEPPTLNPLVPGGDNFIVSIIGQAHLAGAYEIDGATLELIPELLSELPSVGNGGVTINDDGTMTVRYQIRDEAVWSDGVPITGYDFQFTVEVKRQRDFEVDEMFSIESMLAGEKTFEFTLDAPTATFETMFPVVVPKHAVEGTDFMTDWNDVMWPAAGAFVFDEWQRGEYLRLVRNENYWKRNPETGARLPYLDAVEFRFIPEAESLLYSFTQRELDVIQPPPAPEILERLRELESAGAEVQVKPGPVWEHLNFQFGPNNRNPESLNEYSSFRQAIAYAIDTEELARLVGWEPVTSMLSPGVEEGPWAQYEQDVVKARELLLVACLEAERDCTENPPQLIFSTTSNAWARPEIANALIEILGEVGIEVEVQLEDSQLYFGETFETGSWDVGWWAWVVSPGAAGSITMLDVADPDAPPPDGGNYYRWGTPDSSVNDEAVQRFRDILAVARQTVDPEELIALAKALEQILAENMVIMPVAARSVVGAVWADKLDGYEMNPSQAGHTWNIEFWRRIDL